MSAPSLSTRSNLTRLNIDGLTKISLRVAALLFGALACWTFRFMMIGDTLPQIDMADAIVRGDWAMVPNGHWSPFFPFFLALIFKLLSPNAFWEYPTLHLADFLIYVAAMACLEFFLKEFIANLHQEKTAGSRPFPAWFWYVLAYPVAIFTSIAWVLARYSGADMAVAAFVFLAQGIIMRVYNRGFTLPRAMALGIVLGLAYLSKLAMLPVGIIFLAVLGFEKRRDPKMISSLLVCLIFFGLTASPWVYGLSTSKGRFTLGDVGAESYVNAVNDVFLATQDDAEPANIKDFLHPPRKMMSAPDVYEFATPLRATYPVWYDSTYWMEGALRPRFIFDKQVKTFFIWSGYTVHLLFSKNFPGVMLLVILFYLIFRRKQSWWKAFAGQWVLLIPSLAVFVLYALVHSQGRYLAPFVVLVWLAFWRALWRSLEGENQTLVKSLAVGTLTVMLINTAFAVVDESRTVRENIGKRSYWVIANSLKDFFGPASGNFSHAYWVIAQECQALGLREGDKIAAVGDGNRMSLWARVGRFKIVAQVPQRSVDQFCRLEKNARHGLNEKLARLGVKAFVTNSLSCVYEQPGWQRAGQTDYYAYFIPSSTEAAGAPAATS